VQRQPHHGEKVRLNYVQNEFSPGEDDDKTGRRDARGLSRLVVARPRVRGLVGRIRKAMDASGRNPKFTTHVRELERRVGRGDARCILLHMYYRIHTAYAAFVCGAAAPGHFQLHTATARGHGRGGRGGRRASEHSQTKAGIEGMRKRSN
jgi:hypothetical protein